MSSHKSIDHLPCSSSSLARNEVEFFYRLWYTLIHGVNEARHIVPGFELPKFGTAVDGQVFAAIRTELWRNPQWIDEFLAGKFSNGLSENERAVIAAWRDKHISGRFIIMKHLAKYSVFMAADRLEQLYGVCGISDPIREMLPNNLPIMVETTLLPFHGKIIYDTFMAVFNVTFGAGAKADFNESYRNSKETGGILADFDGSPMVSKAPAPKRAKKPQGVNIPRHMASKYDEIAAILTAFCAEKLNDDYKTLTLRALEKLCRKRPSPLESGKPRTWACGIVYAVGRCNFIFDKSQKINMTAAEIAEWFGLSKQTAGNKAAEINRLLNITCFSPDFTLPEIAEKNPLNFFRMW